MPRRTRCTLREAERSVSRRRLTSRSRFETHGHFRVEREVESASFESAGLNPAITIGLADCEHAIAHSFTKNLMVRLFYCSPVSGFLKNDFKIAAADGGRSVLMDDLPARFFF